MRFGVYRPPQAAAGPVPMLFYLAGLDVHEEIISPRRAHGRGSPRSWG